MDFGSSGSVRADHRHSARLGSGPVPLWSGLLLVSGACVILLAWARMRHVRKRINRAERLQDGFDPAEIFLNLPVIAPFVLLGSFAIHVT
jgi:putative membrane protein